MRPYNPKKVPYIYGGDAAGPLGNNQVVIRTPISSAAWYELHGISIHKKQIDSWEELFLNIVDEGTGRSLFSEDISIPAFTIDYKDIGTKLPSAAVDTYFTVPRHPTMLPVPYLLRPGSVIRATVRNYSTLDIPRFRIYYHGLWTTDPASKDQSPGAVMAPFVYVANFGTVSPGSQYTVQVTAQPDSIFDVHAISCTRTLFDIACQDADTVFLTITDPLTGFTYHDRAVHLCHIAGPPLWPYRPIRPIRVLKGGALQVTLNNMSNYVMQYVQIAFHGIKIFG